MLRYAVGEDLDIADIMIWGPNWYYQKDKYFTGKRSGLDAEQCRDP